MLTFFCFRRREDFVKDPERAVSRMLQEGVLLPSLWALFLLCARHLVAITHVVHKPYNSLIIVWRLYEEPYYTRVLRLRQGPCAWPDPGLRGPDRHERREHHGPGPHGVNESLAFPTVNPFRVVRLRGCAWHLTAQTTISGLGRSRTFATDCICASQPQLARRRSRFP